MTTPKVAPTHAPAPRRPLPARIIEAAMALAPGSWHVATVLHDDWCPALRTQSSFDCVCDPIVRMSADPRGGNP